MFFIYLFIILIFNFINNLDDVFCFVWVLAPAPPKCECTCLERVLYVTHVSSAIEQHRNILSYKVMDSKDYCYILITEGVVYCTDCKTQTNV